MAYKKKFVAGVVLGFVLTVPALATQDAPLNASERTAILKTLAESMKAKYIEPAVAERVARALARKNAEGGYASATSALAFSEALAQDLRDFSGDLHFGAKLGEAARKRSDGDASARSEVDAAREQVERAAFQIPKLERLPGNVGYIELRGFEDSESVAHAYTAAMSLMAGSDALILDLRRNGGGNPVSVAYLMSHFLPRGDVRHLNDFYDRRTDTTWQSWTVSTIAQRYDKPVYVLTSARTFSAGEECAYAFQTLKRGTLVGETTGGGANPVGWYGVGNGIVVAIPHGRVTNPITKTSWEHVGVKPDIAAPAAEALQTAHAAILRKLVAAAKEDSERTKLQRVLAMVEKGETEKPIYTLRGER